MSKVIDGIPVVNALESIKITITKRDIGEARRKKAAYCVAAKACKDKLACTDARVYLSRTYLRFNGEWRRYMTPKTLRTELIAFDRGGAFQVGTFEFMPVAPSKRSGKQQGSKKRTPGEGVKHGKLRHLTGVRPHANMER